VATGFEDVPQQIPLTDIAAPPLDEIFPPETAVVVVIEDTAVVVRVAVVGLVVNVTELP